MEINQDAQKTSNKMSSPTAGNALFHWMRREKINLSDATMTCLAEAGVLSFKKASTEDEKNSEHYMIKVKSGLTQPITDWLDSQSRNFVLVTSDVDGNILEFDLVNEPSTDLGPRVSTGRRGSWYVRSHLEGSSFREIEAYQQGCLEKHLLSCDFGFGKLTDITTLYSRLVEEIKSLRARCDSLQTIDESLTLSALSDWCGWAIEQGNLEGLSLAEAVMLGIATRYFCESFLTTLTDLENEDKYGSVAGFRQKAKPISLHETIFHEVEREEFKYCNLERHFSSNEFPNRGPFGWYNVPTIKMGAIFAANVSGVTDIGWRSLGGVVDTRLFHDYNIQACNSTLTQESGQDMIKCCDEISVRMKTLNHFQKYAYLSDASAKFQEHKKKVEQCLNKAGVSKVVVRVQVSFDEFIISKCVDSGCWSFLAYSRCNRDDILAVALSAIVNDINDYSVDILSGEVSQGWQGWAESTGLGLAESAQAILLECFRLATEMPIEPSWLFCAHVMLWTLSNSRHRLLYLWCSARALHGSRVSVPSVVPDYQGMADNSDWSPLLHLLTTHWAYTDLALIIRATEGESVPFPVWLTNAPARVMAHVVVCLALPKIVQLQESKRKSVELEPNLAAKIKPIADKLCEEAGDGWFEFGRSFGWDDRFAKIVTDFAIHTHCGTDLITSVGTFVRGKSGIKITFSGDRACCTTSVCMCPLFTTVTALTASLRFKKGIACKK